MADRRARIVVRVAVDGSVVAETHDIVGPACLDQIAVLEELLEARTETSAFTADYGRTPTRSIQVQEVHDQQRHQ